MLKVAIFNDTLTGNALNNRFIGGLGDDLINGGDGFDTASYISAIAGVKVNLGVVGQQNTIHAGIDTLISIENVIGSNFNDTLIGNAGGNLFTGNLGNDTLNGGEGLDWTNYGSASGGVTVNLGIIGQQNTVNAGLDSLISIENLSGSKRKFSE